MIDIHVASFNTCLPADIAERSLAILPLSLRETILRYRRWEDRQAALLGKLLLLRSLNKYGFAADCLEELQSDSYGRPYLGGSVDFNISHSGEFVLCVLASPGKVGVDVERVRDLDIWEFQRYVSPGNWREILAHENPLERFFDHWTMRESVIKADGRGLSIPLDEVVVHEDTVTLGDKTWFLRKLEIAPGYSCHLATDRRNCQIRMNREAEPWDCLLPPSFSLGIASPCCCD